MKLFRKNIKTSTASIAALLIAAMLTTATFFIHNEREKRQAFSMLRQGVALYNKGSILEAYDLINKARTSMLEIEDRGGSFESTIYLGMIYFHIGQKEDSYKLIKEIDRIDISNHKSYCTQYYYRLMAYFSATVDNNWDMAKRYTQQSIAFSRKHFPNDTLFVYIDMANMAEIYMMGKKTDEAMRLIEKLEKKPIQEKVYLSQLYYCKGMALEEKGATDSAYACYNRALEEARAYKVDDNMQNALKRMIDIDSKKQDTGLYLQHKNELSLIKEKLTGDEIKYKIAVMQNQHLADLKKQQEVRTRCVNIMTIILIVFIMASAMAMVYVIRKNHITRCKMNELINNSIADEQQQKTIRKELEKIKMNSTAHNI